MRISARCARRAIFGLRAHLLGGGEPGSDRRVLASRFEERQVDAHADRHHVRIAGPRCA